MRQDHPKLFGIAWATVMLLFMGGMFAASFVAASFVYDRTDLELPALVLHVVSALLGLILTGLLIGGVMQIARSQGWVPEQHMFGPIIEAIQKIAKGDFSVQLDDNFHRNEPVSVLVQSVNNMALELKQIEALRQEFISNVSHEIQSPLTSIRGFARALQQDNLSREDRNHYLTIIETESMRLSKLSDNLLALASLEAEGTAFEPRPYRIDRQITGVLLACEPQWRDKGIEVDVALDPITISADEALLSQVWTNLIHNSIKFTPPNGCVSIALHEAIGGVAFTIADTGIGIAEHDQAHIFERFFKADASRNRAQGGSGLGLSIAHKIVEIHHGSITVESRLGAGTTFTVRLPAG